MSVYSGKEIFLLNDYYMLIRVEHSALRWDSIRLLSWEDTVVEKHVTAELQFEPTQVLIHDKEGPAAGGDCWSRRCIWDCGVF